EDGGKRHSFGAGRRPAAPVTNAGRLRHQSRHGVMSASRLVAVAIEQPLGNLGEGPAVRSWASIQMMSNRVVGPSGRRGGCDLVERGGDGRDFPCCQQISVGPGRMRSFASAASVPLVFTGSPSRAANGVTRFAWSPAFSAGAAGG